MSNGNLALWESVDKTPPSHTKEVRLGARKFTTIDAYWQIREATRVFGPVGRGWGWTVEYEYFTMGEGGEAAQILVLANVTLWHGSREQTVAAVGAKALFSKGRFDDDAHKKALTDAITKALSYLGFNADVFLGKFDDSKYVAAMREEEAKGNGNGSSTKTNAAQDAVSASLKQQIAQAVKGMGMDLSLVSQALNAMYGVNSLDALDAGKQGVFLKAVIRRHALYEEMLTKVKPLGEDPLEMLTRHAKRTNGETNPLLIPEEHWQTLADEIENMTATPFEEGETT